MRPRSPTDYPFIATPEEEPRVHVGSRRARDTTMRPQARVASEEGGAALLAQVEALRAQIDALALTADLARALGGVRAGEACAALVALRRAVDDGADRLSRALRPDERAKRRRARDG